MVRPYGSWEENDLTKRGDNPPRPLTPRERAKRRCCGRIDGKHKWIFVGGGKYRCENCGAE